MRRTLGLIAVAALVGWAPATASATPAVSFSSRDGLTVTSAQQLDGRLYALTMTTRALPAPVDVRVLLPAGYASQPHRRYPVLYLLDGTSGTAADWTTLGNAEQTTAGLPLIVVMPNIDLGGDGGGWCTTWPDGAESWDTFHISQLLPWVDANLRTLDTRGERAIAGLSQGGFCSMSYAARFPDLFGVSLAYSGAPDIAWDPVAHAGALAIINATEVGLDHVAPDTFFGDPVTDFFNWADHDPATLAGNLRQTKLYMYYGNGLPGPYDTVPNPAAGAIEGAVATDSAYFDNRLRQLGIAPVVYDPYGNGTHSWPYWARDLRWSIGDVMADFAHPAPAPTTFSYESGAASYSEYGWAVSVSRKVDEFSTLSVRGRAGFTLQGSGTATVVTPAMFTRRGRYRLRIRSGTGTLTRTVRAGRTGALRVSVPLGTSNTVQEYSLGEPPAASPGTTVYTTTVSIARVRR